ncbi:MAG: hypothetical protein JHC37_07390 [Campylobacteraceae bacterium]|nr:hypothetical protein [Campylobacteraceae bacterium]
MSLKNYTLFSFLYVCLVGLIAMFNVAGEYSFSFLGWTYTLPSAVWVVVPLILFFVATIAHMSYYGFINYLKINSYKHDYEMLIEQISAKFLGNEEEKEYKNQEFKTLADFIIQCDIKPKSRFKLNIPKIDKIAETIHKIEDLGEYVDISKYRLSKENSLMQKNLENRIAVEPKYSQEVLKSCDKLTPLCQKAFDTYVEFGDLKQIKKLDITPTKAIAIKLITRFSGSDEEYELDKEYVKELCAITKFAKEDYIALAKALIKKLNPDETLELFFILSRDNIEAIGAYIYVNLELEVIDKAKELLAQSGDDEFLEFKAFLCLKEKGKNLRLSSFLEALQK